jgi:type VI secretion system protein VasG
MEKHHGVLVLDEALAAAVKLSHRYIPERQLPDKSISLLDTACARVAVSQHATPPEIVECQSALAALSTEAEILSREAAVGIGNAERRADVTERTEELSEHLAELRRAWDAQKKLVEEILSLRASLTSDSPSAPQEAERTDLLLRLRSLQADLATLQGESPLILPSVDSQAVAAVVASWTGIPVGRMMKDDIAAVLDLENVLSQRVIGQDHSLRMISRRVQTARAGLENPVKPVGVFLLAGPSGVGKTETALAVAEALYGGDQNVITVNMSEFQEAHTVSTLKGAPPGYVGYGQGGVLTEAVRRKPHSVVLLDEVEKAHPDVHEIFFQVFDKGQMEDGEGQLIDFRNTLIILTTNIGTDLIARLCNAAAGVPDPEAIAAALREPLLRTFPPALLGRLVVIPYYPLNDSTLGRIVRLQLDRVVKRMELNHSIEMSYAEDVVKLVAARCTEPESGGRMIDAIMTNSLLPQMGRELLTRMSDGVPTKSVGVAVENEAFVCRFQ